MAKIKRIGNKKEILKKKKDSEVQSLCIDAVACHTEKQLDSWFKQHFSGLPGEAQEGLKVIVKALWAGSKMKHKPAGHNNSN